MRKDLQNAMKAALDPTTKLHNLLELTDEQITQIENYVDEYICELCEYEYSVNDAKSDIDSFAYWHIKCNDNLIEDIFGDDDDFDYDNIDNEYAIYDACALIFKNKFIEEFGPVDDEEKDKEKEKKEKKTRIEKSINKKFKAPLFRPLQAKFVYLYCGESEYTNDYNEAKECEKTDEIKYGIAVRCTEDDYPVYELDKVLGTTTKRLSVKEKEDILKEYIKTTFKYNIAE